MKKETGCRIAYLEKIRIIAIVMVLFCHSGDKLLTQYQVLDNSFLKIFFIMLASLTQSCIELFFMISGAVLLSKKESVKKILLNRFLPMLAITLSVVVIQCLYNIVFLKYTLSFADIMKAFYCKGALTEQWFLYYYLSFLLILPFLQILTNAVDNDVVYKYLFIMVVVAKVIAPMFEAVTDWYTFGVDFPFVETIIFCPLMGYYLENRPHTKLYEKKTKFIIGIGLTVLITANAFMNYHSYIYGGKLAYLTLFIDLYAVGIFILMRSTKVVGKKSIVYQMGSGVFGVYLFERQFKAVASLITGGFDKYLPDFVNGIIEIVLCLAIGIPVVCFCKYIFEKVKTSIKTCKEVN